jgi:hypothetical protein
MYFLHFCLIIWQQKSLCEIFREKKFIMFVFFYFVDIKIKRGKREIYRNERKRGQERERER